MTPAARVQAAIEVLDLVIASARDGGPPADAILSDYFRTRRYAGSGDRRAVRDLVYGAIRRSGERPDSGRAAMLGLAEDAPELLALFGAGGHGPAPVTLNERRAPASLAPEWLTDLFAPEIDGCELQALLTRAPLDVRVNRLKADIAEVSAALPQATPAPHAPDGLRLPEGERIETHPWFRDGRVEVQDAGSQLVALAARAEPGMTAVDLCAGAGGKTLALAAAMRNEGRLIATDTDRGRLSRLPDRAARAGATVETRLLDPGRELDALGDLVGAADVVLVDAPCSGAGTWRRSPELRWRLTPERLARLVHTQAQVLDVAAELTRPGGALVYAVCSVLSAEGEEQGGAFLSRHSGWTSEELFATGRPSGPGRILTPAHDGTDGFWVARFLRPC